MNPFARRSQMAPVGNPVNNFPNNYSQNGQDPVDYASEMIRRSGGDAKAAFYSACKEKGVDADSFIQQVRFLKNPQGELQNLLLNNPKAKSLLSLFSSVK